MNDEIKEILDYLKQSINENELDIELSREEVKQLLDFITNLQQELENKNNEIDILKGQVEWWMQQCDDLEMQAGVDYE